MLSVIVAPGDSDRLPGLLAALTSAAVEGLVREVLLVGEAAHPLIAALCDDTGAEAVPDLPTALAAARGDLLLVAPPEWRPREGWIERLAAHLRDTPRSAVIRGLGGGFLKPAAAAFLAPRAAVQGVGDLSALKRRLGVRPARLA